LEYKIERPGSRKTPVKRVGLGSAKLLVELNKPEDQPDHDDNADNPEYVVHFRSPDAVAPQILRIILFLQLEH